MTKSYRIQEFAELAGVTVKALHHYDRLGLLKPRRTPSGYRLYVERDLERLEQIIALKFLGVPLRKVKEVLEQATLELPATLRLQRKALEEKQETVSRAIRAVRAAEKALEAGKPAAPAILRRIIEVIDMRDDIEAMRKYYSTEAAWEKRRKYYEEGPSQAWQELYRDIGAALEEDPSSETAQTLADRWLDLSAKAYGGDPDLQTDSPTAWIDREHWPAAMKRRIAEFNLEEVNQFMQRTARCSRKKYFSEEAWARLDDMRKQGSEHFSVLWQTRVDLFRDIQSSLEENPAGETGRALAARWSAHLDAASGGDPDVKSGLLKAWADRRNWRATIRWREEGLSMMNSEQFERAADFIDKAVASAQGK